VSTLVIKCLNDALLLLSVYVLTVSRPFSYAELISRHSDDVVVPPQLPVDQLLRSFWHRLCSRDERDEEVRMFCSVGSLFSRSQSTVSSLFQLKLF